MRGKEKVSILDVDLQQTQKKKNKMGCFAFEISFSAYSRKLFPFKMLATKIFQTHCLTNFAIV